MNFNEDIMALVIDNGSWYMKVGFSGDDAPRGVFPCIVGRPNTQSNLLGMMGQKDAYIGDEAQTRRRILMNYSNPIEKRQFTHWGDLEKIWHHSFYNELRVAPEEHCILLTESVLNPKASRERMTQIMFETFNVQGTFLIAGSVLSLYASGRTTGVVLDSGHEITQIVPIYDGYRIPHTMEQVEIGGKDVTNFMVKLLQERGYNFTTSSEREMVRDMKEKFGYVAPDFQSEMKLSEEENVLFKEYELYSGLVVELQSERFKCVEALFQLNLVGKEGPGVHFALLESIKKCDQDIRDDMFRNVVLAGGNTMFEGMRDRIKRELRLLAPEAEKINVIAPPERKYSTWIGGSIFSSLSTMDSMWITRDAYDEKGPSIVHEKCF